jgi:L-ribulose-5-phosphate 4-epimerase
MNKSMTGLEELREEVFEANLEIYRTGLVTMRSENASGIDRERKCIVIKPSGMDYEKLSPCLHVVTDLNGQQLKTENPGDDLNPSVYLPHHVHLYTHCPGIGGIVHTHSNYTNSFALSDRPIIPCLTAIADEFGGEIPFAPYVDNLGDHIGEAILKYRTYSPAVLLGRHGGFAFGPRPPGLLSWRRLRSRMWPTAEEVQKWRVQYHSAYG